jgi:phytoene synthase
LRDPDLAACADAIRHGSKSFHAASLMLPRRVRGPALALYAFCRFADDAVDLNERKPGAVLSLRDRLARAYEGRPVEAPADRAFARMIAATAMPRALPEALIEGFAWDAVGRRYRTLDGLVAYSARVAASVGVMMTVIMGVRSRAALARAADLGVAMQLTNIARDVGEDAREGRLYLPLDWLEAEGIDPDRFLAAPAFGPALARVVAQLLAEADRFYARADAGIPALPRDCRAAILAARLIYAGIAGEVRAAGFDSVSRRAATTKRRKVALAAAAMLRAPLLRRGPALGAPPHPELRFLVEAAAVPEREARPFGSRVLGLIDILAELEARDRAARSGLTGAR